MKSGKTFLIVFLFTLGASFFYLDLSRYLSLEYVQSELFLIDAYFRAEPLTVCLIFVLLYTIATALSLPGASVMTLVGGAVFGLGLGTALVSISTTVGATLSFLMARYLFRDAIEKRFATRLKTINAGIDKNGIFYLFFLRLAPIFPFFLINLLMGLTSMRMPIYVIVTQLGMLPATVLYVNAGTAVSQINSDVGILTPQLVGAFICLALFPLFVKNIITLIRK